MKRTLLLLLVLSLIITAFACAAPDNEPDDSTQDTSASGDNETNPGETTLSADEIDDLGNQNFGNVDFNILTRKSTSYEVLSDDLSGDIVSDAVHNRNTSIEERFEVQIKVTERDGDWGTRDSFMAVVQNDILSGLREFDLVMTHSAYIVNMAAKGNGYDMKELDNIDFNKKWWCLKYIDNASMSNRYYNAMGDIGYTLYQYLMCVFYNKTIAQSVELPDLYELVENGTWTFEKLKEYSYLVSGDLDGSGTYDENDLYGFAINGHTCRMTATFWDSKMTVADSTGRQAINLPNEKYLNIYDQLYDLIYNNKENVFFIGEGSVIQTNMFLNEQLLFFSEKLGNAATMKNMESEYGILPFPKYDEQQDNYISSARDALTAIMVMSNISNPEMVGTITEALCMVGYQVVTPAYYETSLKLKYLSDPVAMQMLDLIRDSMTYEFCAIYTNSINLIYAVLGTNLLNGVESINTIVTKSTKLWQSLINKLYEDFEKLD